MKGDCAFWQFGTHASGVPVVFVRAVYRFRLRGVAGGAAVC